MSKIKIEQAKLLKYKLEKFKKINKRNLKILSTISNYLVPFFASASITIGTFKLLGFGFPFQKDDVFRYKEYDLDYNSNEYVTMNEEYVNKVLFPFNKSNISITLYTPWEYKDNQYIRYKRVYDIKSNINIELIDAVLDNDYNKINELLDYNEETQISNTIDSNISNNYYVEAKLNFLDKTDYIKYSEKTFSNVMITIAELSIILILGFLVNYLRSFNLLDRLKNINNMYNIDNIIEDISDIKRKILSLKTVKDLDSNDE